MPPRLIVPLFALLVVGCDEATGPAKGGVAVSREWVTGPAAAALDATDRFIFPPIPVGVNQLSPDDASRLAKAFYTTVATSTGNLNAALEEQHGGSIDFTALAPCDRVIPITAPFQPAEVTAEAQYVRDMMAARYEVELCQRDGSKAVGLDISVDARVTVGPQGTLQWPGPPIITGAEFFAFGVPLSTRVLRDDSYGLWALSPEAAVGAVYALLHTPVQSVPQATGCLWFLMPCIQHAARLWRIEIAQPVSIRRQGAAENELAQVFYVQVGNGANRPGGVYVAALAQPSAAYLDYDFVRDQRALSDKVLLTLSQPLAMDSFTVAGR